jgi:hypothetical protein
MPNDVRLNLFHIPHLYGMASTLTRQIHPAARIRTSNDVRSLCGTPLPHCFDPGSKHLLTQRVHLHDARLPSDRYFRRLLAGTDSCQAQTKLVNDVYVVHVSYSG